MERKKIEGGFAVDRMEMKSGPIPTGLTPYKPQFINISTERETPEEEIIHFTRNEGHNRPDDLIGAHAKQNGHNGRKSNLTKSPIPVDKSRPNKNSKH